MSEAPGGTVAQQDEREDHSQRRVADSLDNRVGTRWLTTRSPGEILALVALVISVFALLVVINDADTLGSVAQHINALIAQVQAEDGGFSLLSVIVGATVGLALAIAIRARDTATVRAARLLTELSGARQQIQKLESTVKARDELLLEVVHELRTPLTHVVGYAELMSGEVRPQRPEEVGAMSAAIRSASTTMLRLMDDLVEATRLQTDGFGLKARPVDLVQLIRGVVAEFAVATAEATAAGRPSRLSVDLPNHWLTVMADPERIRQVLGNLLSNAITYSPSGGEVRVGAVQQGDLVRVEVADQGIGLAPADQERVFERFYRGTDGKRLRESGSGLGLAIVRDLVQAHGGQVGVTSTLGEGSTFWFTLRAGRDLPNPAEPRQPVPRTAPAAPFA